MWTVLAQQIQLHKHASKNPAISAEPLMCVLIMQRSVRKRDALEVLMLSSGSDRIDNSKNMNSYHVALSLG